MLRRTLPLALLCAALGSGPAGAAQKPKPTIDPGKYLTTDKLRRGMKGYGLTVFRGTKPEKFGVEIIGVMRNVWDVGSDIILIRCSGQNLEHTGIAAGMSGSPIYVDGKLIGALAYGWTFAKAPLAGVTPIAEMLPLAERAKAKKTARATASLTLKEPITVYGKRFAEVTLATKPASPGPIPAGAIDMCPIATPVRLTGLGPPNVAPRLLKAFGPEFRELGLMPVLGGDATGNAARDAKLEPGTTIGARLLWGDLNWEAIGTVTEVVGNRVLALGHPMYSDADVDIPMTAGYIYTIMPSFSRTFKMGAGTRILGRIDTDRSKGICGTLGATGKSVKIRVSISGLGREKKTYRLEALRHPRITPAIAAAAVGSCLFQAGEPPEELTGRYKLTVVPEGRDPIVIENVASGWAGSESFRRLYGDVRTVLSALTGNKFQRLYPLSVTVEVTFEAARRAAVIETVALDRTEVRRGETLRATVELKHLKGARERRVIDLPIPPDAALGPAVVQVCGSIACATVDRKDFPGRFDPKTLDQFLGLVGQVYRRDQLYVRLSCHGLGVAMEGKELRDLPASVYGLMAAGRHTGLTVVRGTTVTRAPCNVVVSGSHLLKIRIREAK